MAKLESKVERTVPLSKITPASAPRSVCSRCLRPYHVDAEIEYICDTCRCAHYRGEFYICCSADAKRPLRAKEVKAA
jgi:hypothetical protein